MMNLLRNVLSREVLPLLTASAALAAFALGYLGLVSPAFDLIAQFTMHWLAIAIVAVVASFLVSHAYGLLALAPALACLLPAGMAYWYATDPAVPPAPAAMSIGSGHVATGAAITGAAPTRRFRLLSYNIYNLNTDIEAIVGEIRRHDADVIALVEFGPNKQGLKERLRDRYPHFKTCEDNWDCGVAIFSRLPVTSFTLVRPGDDAGPPFVAADVSLAGRRVTVIATHILSPNHGPRANFIELDHLARRVRSRNAPMVVAGDLNTTIWANAFDNFRVKSGLLHMGRLIPTWPTRPLSLPQLGIDHVFVSPELRITNVRAGAAGGSDHLPLVADIELR